MAALAAGRESTTVIGRERKNSATGPAFVHSPFGHFSVILAPSPSAPPVPRPRLGGALLGVRRRPDPRDPQRRGHRRRPRQGSPRALAEMALGQPGALRDAVC